jgi:hypothetical protein
MLGVVFLVSFAGRQVSANVLPPGSIDTCGELAAVGTYTLTSNIGTSTGACITITSNSVILNGSGYTITGNVVGDGVNPGSPGFNFILQNLNVIGTTSSNGADNAPPNCIGGSGGNGGNIIMSTSTSNVVTADGGNFLYHRCSTEGNGGNITISGQDVNLSTTTISAKPGGTLAVDFSNTVNVIGMRMSPLSNVTINSPINTPGSLGSSNGGIIGTLPGGTVSNPSQCNLALAGTYTLNSNISGDCTITANGVVINGGGYTITGQVNGTSPDPNTNGSSFTLDDLTVLGTTTSAGMYGTIFDSNYNCLFGYYRLSGGNITITDSTTTSIITDGSVKSVYHNFTCGDYGSPGSVNITDSKFTSISAQGYKNARNADAGGIDILGHSIDLSSVSIDLEASDLSYEGGYGGVIKINYESMLTNASTSFQYASNLMVNGFNFGYWNGVYNPLGLYFNDSQTDDGNWQDPLNWWNDASTTIPAGAIPTGISQYVVSSSSVTENTGHSPVPVDTITFNNGSINAIDISANKVVFNDTSRNAGTITGGEVIFNGNQSENDATTTLFALNPRGYVGHWTSITSSSDGTKLAAVVTGGQIYTSTDSGITWTVSSSSPTEYWGSITSSSDGTKLAAGVTGGYGGQIYTSTDSGITWTVSSSSPTEGWSSITSSSDGTELAAVVNGLHGGQIYTSTDSGITWTPHGPNMLWSSITSSSDGTKLAAANVSGGQIYTSTDSGITWTPHGPNMSLWRSITSSSDGTKLAAVVKGLGYGGQIYTSTDSGITWTVSSSSPTEGWSSITSSSDGTKLAAVVYGGQIYTSTDSGATWTPHGPNINWSSITSSSDGTKLAGDGYSSQIYTMINSLTTIHRSGIIASSTPIRQYTVNTVVGARDFTSSGNWIIQANGAVANISSSTYNTSVDTFETLNGGSFITNPTINGGAPVVPQFSIASPIANATTTKWLPSVNWASPTAVTCQYSYDDFATMHTADCSKNGSDIAKPSSAGTQTLYVQGADSRGDFNQESVTFDYDNTSPVYTSCGSDILDESTRQYYYLTGNITGNCVATIRTTLYGDSTTTSTSTGYTVSGDIIATSTTNGIGITLKNIIVDGSVIASGASKASGNGYNGGNITIDPSVTGPVISNGGSGTTGGGNGGNINITNSTGAANTNTPVSANGGDATYCGYGGNGGSIALVNSEYATPTSNPGQSMTATFANGGFCPNILSGGSVSFGGSGSVQVSGQYTPPASIITPTPPTSPAISPVVNDIPPITPGSLSGIGSSIGSIIGVASSSPVSPVVVSLPGPSSFVSSFGSAIANTAATVVRNTVKTANAIANSPATRTIQATGFLAGLVASIISVANTAYAAPLAAEAILTPVRLWGLALMGLGIRKRRRPWGTVYDSVTKRPIDPAYVTVKDTEGKTVAEAITDMDGRYGFLLHDGTYYISVKKTNYEFPSEKMEGKSFDELYNNLYFGGPVTVTSGQVLDKNIPMDPKGFDWNEEAKKKLNAFSFHSKNEKWWSLASNYIYGFGFLVSAVTVAVHRSAYNVTMMLLYAAVIAFLYFISKNKRLGHVTDSSTHMPLSYAIMRVTAADHETVLRSAVCDVRGRYYCIVPKGQYYVDIEKKNLDGSYSKAYISSLISSNTGVLNQDFAV